MKTGNSNNKIKTVTSTKCIVEIKYEFEKVENRYGKSKLFFSLWRNELRG